MAVVRSVDPPPEETRAFESAAATLAHEINNPLAIVFANLDFVIGELETSAAGREFEAALREAREAAERRDAVAWAGSCAGRGKGRADVGR